LRSKVRVFVELYKRGEEIKRQQELIRESELREADRIRREQVWSLEQEHMRQLNLELEERVSQRTSELVIANEELEALCYSVSHDLRAPLRAIMSTSMSLLEENEGKLAKEHIELLFRQAQNADRLGKLIDDLLQLSRIGRRTIERKKVDITAIARDIAGEILEQNEECRWNVKVEDGLEAIGDPSLVRLILQNLIDNACKYSPEGGHIEVGALVGDEPTFYVKDSGIGFDMKYAPKIFLPFERLVLESEFPGTGIGLATVQRIIRKHGGKIWVESALGEGSTFYFTLASRSGDYAIAL
jgi:signal transduction histidine kinase